MWGCGLKYISTAFFLLRIAVHPRTGVWVETLDFRHRQQQMEVHPHTGVWVEIPLCVKEFF